METEKYWSDLIAKGASVFANRVGEQVATPLVTLIDDGTMAGEWGHFAIDDEGRPAALLRDPEGYSDRELLLSQPALFVAAHFDGEHAFRD